MFVLTEPLLIDTLCHIASHKPRDGSPPVQVHLLLDNRSDGDPETDDERNELATLAKLHHHGINIRLHDNDGTALLHMKSAVIDKNILITGTANWSSMAFHHNIEDVLIIRDTKIALAYHDRITSLAQKARPYEPDGRDKPPKRIPRSQLQAQNTSNLLQGRWHRQLEKNPLITPFPLPSQENITILFPHHQRYLPVLLELFSNTKHTLTAAFFSLTHDTIRRAITERQDLPAITLLLDEVAFRNDLFCSRLQRIQEAGAEVHICMADGKKNSMHLKAAVFDEAILWRGSANWSVNANERFLEDILIFRCQTLAQHYLNQFEKIKNTLCKKYKFD